MPKRSPHPLPELSPTLPVPPVPSRKSSLVDRQSPHPDSIGVDDDMPRLPSSLMDKVVQRKASSTWPRALGKKVAPWTSMEETKTSILGTAFDAEPPLPAPRRMKILKPVRRNDGVKEDEDGGEVFKVDVVRDVVRMEVKDKDDEQGKSLATKNLGGGAFHWMK